MTEKHSGRRAQVGGPRESHKKLRPGAPCRRQQVSSKSCHGHLVSPRVRFRANIFVPKTTTLRAGRPRCCCPFALARRTLEHKARLERQDGSARTEPSGANSHPARPTRTQLNNGRLGPPQPAGTIALQQLGTSARNDRTTPAHPPTRDKVLPPSPPRQERSGGRPALYATAPPSVEAPNE